MAAAKKLFVTHTQGLAVYALIQRVSDGYYMDSADGVFKVAPAAMGMLLTENTTLRGLYTLTESRTLWTDGEYRVMYYVRLGGAGVYAPATDTLIRDENGNRLFISGDADISASYSNAILIYLRAAMSGAKHDIITILESLEAIQKSQQLSSSAINSLGKAQRRI